MYTDEEISDLIRQPKSIISKDPLSGYRDEANHRRANLRLRSLRDGTDVYEVFLRQHRMFLENFSIGLRYRTGTQSSGTITLVRYNGPHGDYSIARDLHFARPHIHLLTQDELAAGHLQPRELRREETDQYGTFEEAMLMFLEEIATNNHYDFFPELRQARLFNEP